MTVEPTIEFPRVPIVFFADARRSTATICFAKVYSGIHFNDADTLMFDPIKTFPVFLPSSAARGPLASKSIDPDLNPAEPSHSMKLKTVFASNGRRSEKQPTLNFSLFLAAETIQPCPSFAKYEWMGKR